MAFPCNPHNGEKYKYNTYTFEYDLTLQAWIPEGMERPIDFTGYSYVNVATTGVTSGPRSSTALVRDEDTATFTKLLPIEFERYMRFESLRWRYERNAREVRLGVPTTDNIADLDAYAQALANVTDQGLDGDIVWPTLG